jgi:hypothetical protein
MTSHIETKRYINQKSLRTTALDNLQLKMADILSDGD